jgi:hypothetical protein
MPNGILNIFMGKDDYMHDELCLGDWMPNNLLFKIGIKMKKKKSASFHHLM